MANNSVEWINRHVQAGRSLYAKGCGASTDEEADAWKVDEEHWWQEARREVENRSPQDAARLEPIGRLQPLPLPTGHPLAVPSVPNITAPATSEGFPGSDLFSIHYARFERLEEIARDWRVNPPEPIIKQFPIWSNEAEEAYAERVASFLKDTGKRPTKDADFAWGKKHGLRRGRVRELRKKFSRP